LEGGLLWGWAGGELAPEGGLASGELPEALVPLPEGGGLLLCGPVDPVGPVLVLEPAPPDGEGGVCCAGADADVSPPPVGAEDPLGAGRAVVPEPTIAAGGLGVGTAVSLVGSLGVLAVSVAGAATDGLGEAGWAGLGRLRG
jgi:hypothetical protein